jgi:sporulation protein YlmC with PRC-barrel domain
MAGLIVSGYPDETVAERAERKKPLRLELGCPVRCSNDVFGELSDVVIDPTDNRVSHLVVQPRHQHRLARLVPAESAVADSAEQGQISLSCTVEEVRQLASVQEFAYLELGEFPPADPDWDVGVEDVLTPPYDRGTTIFGGYVDVDPHVGISYDRIPKGEVEIRRASAVSSADGHRLGHVDGFIVDRDEQITHLALKHGHLWSRREMTIPIRDIGKLATDVVILNISKDEVEARRRLSADSQPRLASPRGGGGFLDVDAIPRRDEGERRRHG